MVSGQLPPKENFPLFRGGVWVKVRVSFTVRGNETIVPEENCAPVTVRVWLRASFVVGGAIFLGGNCPRTVVSLHISRRIEVSQKRLLMVGKLL